MSFYSIVRGSLLYLCLLFLGARPSFAFDPFTVTAVVGTTVNTVQSIAGASKEAAAMANTLSVLAELGTEIDSDAGSDADKVNRRIHEIENLALEAGYTRDELEDILSDQKDDSQSLATTLNKITRSIRLGKRLVALAGFSTQKAAEVSSLEQARSQNEERKVLSQIYGHMIRSELEHKKEELQKRKQITEEVGKLRGFLLSIAPGGNLNLFPVQNSIVRKAIEVFQSYSRVLLALVGIIFFGRVIYYQFSFAAPEKYADLIKETFACFFLMLVFPTLYGYLAEYSEALSVKLGQMLNVTGAILPESKKLWGLALPWWCQPAVVRSVVYLLIYSVFNLVLAVLIAIGPIVILAGTMLDFSISLPAYFGMLILIWLWPVIWNITGYFADTLWRGKDWSASGIAEAVTAGLFYLFQLLSPLVLFKHLQRTQLGQALQGSARSVTQAVAAPPSHRASAAPIQGGSYEV